MYLRRSCCAAAAEARPAGAGNGSSRTAGHSGTIWRPAVRCAGRCKSAHAGLPVDNNLHFVEIDFAERPDLLLPTLAEYGFQPDKPAFFVWLGVQPYLTIEHVLQTARVVGSCPAGTQLATDLLTPDTSWSGIGERVGKLLQDSPHRELEPFKSYSDPAALKKQLLACGFTMARSVEAEEADALYCSERTDGLSYPNCAAMMLAEV